MEIRKQIKDMGLVLKNLEPYVKDPAYLKTGRRLNTFRLLPREMWANWLLCTVLRQIHGDHITFAEDGDTDGLIVDRRTGQSIATEHVSALENEFNRLLEGEARIIAAINLKIDRGPDYANGKLLVVFFDGAKHFYRSKIRESIKGRHNFVAVHCIGLLSSDATGYRYIVTTFSNSFGDKSSSFKVEINSDFTAWKVSHMTE